MEKSQPKHKKIESKNVFKIKAIEHIPSKVRESRGERNFRKV
jgi:hypothetical protein